MASQIFSIVDVTLAEDGILRFNPDVEQERTVAAVDLLEENYFRLTDDTPGPYHLHLAVRDNKLRLEVRCVALPAERRIALALTGFRKIIKDYFTICESYYAAIRTASPSRIEAIDMGRRGLHDEGSERLRERLSATVEIDTNTARRLFTLLCVLQLRA